VDHALERAERCQAFAETRRREGSQSRRDTIHQRYYPGHRAVLFHHRWSWHPLDDGDHRGWSLRHLVTSSADLICAAGLAPPASPNYIAVRCKCNTILWPYCKQPREARYRSRLSDGQMGYVRRKSSKNPPTNELRNSNDAPIASKATRIIVIGAMPTSPKMPSTKAPTRQSPVHRPRPRRAWNGRIN
jgi:hypothetical protein